MIKVFDKTPGSEVIKIYNDNITLLAYRHASNVGNIIIENGFNVVLLTKLSAYAFGKLLSENEVMADYLLEAFKDAKTNYDPGYVISVKNQDKSISYYDECATFGNEYEWCYANNLWDKYGCVDEKEYCELKSLKMTDVCDIAIDYSLFKVSIYSIAYAFLSKGKVIYDNNGTILKVCESQYVDEYILTVAFDNRVYKAIINKKNTKLDLLEFYADLVNMRFTYGRVKAVESFDGKSMITFEGCSERKEFTVITKEEMKLDRMINNSLGYEAKISRADNHSKYVKCTVKFDTAFGANGFTINIEKAGIMVRLLI